MAFPHLQLLPYKTAFNFCPLPRPFKNASLIALAGVGAALLAQTSVGANADRLQANEEAKDDKTKLQKLICKKKDFQKRDTSHFSGLPLVFPY